MYLQQDPGLGKTAERQGVTLQLLWEEYVDAHAASRTYRYTQFRQLYKDWASTLILRIGTDSNGSSPANP
jgi:hypothetical protein